MMTSPWPQTQAEAIKICLITLTAQEQQALRNTAEQDLILSHMGWAVNIRNEFGMWKGNTDLLRSCGAENPDEASMVIVRAVWQALRQ